VFSQTPNGGCVIKYTYDWKGRRLEREDETASSNGPKRRYYFVGLTPVAERTATYIGSYSWSDDVFNTLTGGSIGQVLWRRTSGSTDNSLHYDHIGNVLAEANTSGVVTLANQQDAYGRPILSSAGGWGDNTLHLTTKPWDDSSELFYFNARWYDSAVGSYTFSGTGLTNQSVSGSLYCIECPGRALQTFRECKDKRVLDQLFYNMYSGLTESEYERRTAENAAWWRQCMSDANGNAQAQMDCVDGKRRRREELQEWYEATMRGLDEQYWRRNFPCEEQYRSLMEICMRDCPELAALARSYFINDLMDESGPEL